MDLELKGKRVLITGASRGIGASVAERFLMEGANVILVSRGSENLYKTGEILKIKFSHMDVDVEVCNCTDEGSLNALKDRVNEKGKSIDILIVNVGDGRSVPDPLPEKEQWDLTWNNNFHSSLFTARVFLPLLIKSKGCIIFVSSIVGVEALGAPVDYSTAKAAVISMSKNLARKLAPDVRVNVVAPGNIFFNGGVWDQKLKDDKHNILKK